MIHYLCMLLIVAVVTEQQRLTINAHLGTEVTYHWFFGNGDEYVSQDNYANYTWMDDGVYNITLRAYNDISEDIFEVGCAAPSFLILDPPPFSLLIRLMCSSSLFQLVDCSNVTNFPQSSPKCVNSPFLRYSNNLVMEN